MGHTVGTHGDLTIRSEPTTLDALAFAYLYAALEESHDVEVKQEVQKWVNLVAWEKRVRSIVQSAMRKH